MSQAYQSMQNRAMAVRNMTAIEITSSRGTVVSLTHHSFHSSTSHDGMS